MSTCDIYQFSIETVVFLKNYTDAMPLNLAINLIEQFGGEEEFISNHQQGADGGINLIQGFKGEADTSLFFAENKEMVMEYLDSLPNVYGLNDINEMLVNRDKLSDTFTLSELNNILHDVDDEDHEWIVAVVISFIAELFCYNYAQYIAI